MSFRAFLVGIWLVSGMGILACAKGTPGPPSLASKPTATWVRRLPYELRLTPGMISLEQNRFCWVDNHALERAASLLESRRSMRLSDEEAIAFGASAIETKGSPDSHWFLLRGVEILGKDPGANNRDTADLLLGEDSLSIRTAGYRAWPGFGTRNRAILVRIKELPSEVYADVQIAYVGGVL